MNTKSESTLTAAEAEVMNVIWNHSPTVISDIVDRLPRTLAYTTVMTTVRILEEKGFVERIGKQGRAFLYQPTVSKGEVQCSMIHQLADRLFGGSIKSLVLNLVEGEEIASDELTDIRRMIKELESDDERS